MRLILVRSSLRTFTPGILMKAPRQLHDVTYHTIRKHLLPSVPWTSEQGCFLCSSNTCKLLLTKTGFLIRLFGCTGDFLPLVWLRATESEQAGLASWCGCDSFGRIYSFICLCDNRAPVWNVALRGIKKRNVNTLELAKAFGGPIYGANGTNASTCVNVLWVEARI